MFTLALIGFIIQAFGAGLRLPLVTVLEVIADVVLLVFGFIFA